MSRLMVRCFALLLTTGMVLAGDSFEQATKPPARPDVPETIAGKSVAECRDFVKKEWNKIEFEKDGKPVVYQVTFETTAGDMVCEFFPKDAPNHAKSMILLAKSGFYDGLVFHRTMKGFMIQGGCPKGDGTGGPGYQLKQEFNKRDHVKGILSMARAQDPDSAGSQFFIVHGNADFLNNQYTVFGEVVKGLDVLDKIATAPVRSLGREASTPLEPVKIKKATVKIKE